MKRKLLIGLIVMSLMVQSVFGVWNIFSPGTPPPHIIRSLPVIGPWLFHTGDNITFNETHFNLSVAGLINDSHIEGTGPWLYDNFFNMFFNETKLNQTIKTLDRFWTIDSDWLINVSNTLTINETKLNNTMDARDTDTSNRSNYWDGHDTIASFYLLNESSENLTKADITGFGFLETAVESLSSADNYISVDNPTGVVQIDFNDTKLETQYFNASALQVVTGTGAGNIAYLRSDDGITYNVTETNSDYELIVNFTGITEFTTILVKHKTSEKDDHQAAIELWNKNTSAWDGFGFMPEEVTSQMKTLGVYNDDNYIDSGVVRLRIYQEENPPNTAHIHQFDWVVISKGFGTPVGREGDPLALHRDGNIKLSGNWYVGSYNVSGADWISATIINASDVLIEGVSIKSLIDNNVTKLEGAIASNNLTQENIEDFGFNIGAFNNSEVSNEGLVLEMPFDSSNYVNSSLTLDSSSSQNDGLVDGVAFNSSGGIGNSGDYIFDGSNNYVSIAHDASISFTNLTPFTVSAWIKPVNAYQNSVYFLAKYSSNNAYYFRIYHTYTQFGIITTGDNASIQDISGWSPNVWSHLVGTYDGVDTASFYVDGSLIGSDTGNYTDFSNAQALILGKLAVGIGTIFNGSIDEVKIWNRSLSATEIQNLYEQKAKSRDSFGYRAKDNTWYGTNTFASIIATSLKISGTSQFDGLIDLGGNTLQVVTTETEMNISGYPSYITPYSDVAGTATNITDITGGVKGNILYMTHLDSTDSFDVVIKNDLGNIHNSGSADLTISDRNDVIQCINQGTSSVAREWICWRLAT